MIWLIIALVVSVTLNVLTFCMWQQDKSVGTGPVMIDTYTRNSKLWTPEE